MTQSGKPEWKFRVAATAVFAGLLFSGCMMPKYAPDYAPDPPRTSVQKEKLIAIVAAQEKVIERSGEAEVADQRPPDPQFLSEAELEELIKKNDALIAALEKQKRLRARKQ